MLALVTFIWSLNLTGVFWWMRMIVLLVMKINTIVSGFLLFFTIFWTVLLLLLRGPVWLFAFSSMLTILYYAGHLMENIESKNLLHRAFSVFLFNSKYELLLQVWFLSKILVLILFTIIYGKKKFVLKYNDVLYASFPLINLEDFGWW